ncbi:MAG: tryptophan--tRNA ligase [Candidatus Norongarragalinales archaeon]
MTKPEGERKELDPWSTALVKDYDDLFQNFGLQRITLALREKLSDSRNFRRGIVFAHRDFDKFVAAAERGEATVVMSGIKPSSEFHLGSKLTAEEIVYLQKKFDSQVHYCVADFEAYADNGLNYEQSAALAVDNVADLLALGLDERKAVIYKQSRSLPVLNLALRASRKTTPATLEALYGHKNLALYLAVLVQAGDILHPQLAEFGSCKHVCVPVGIDQDPHIRFARDLAAKMSFTAPAATFHRLFRSLGGETKMSKRDPLGVITLNDSPEQVKRKLANAFTGGRATVAEQRRLGAEYEKCVVAELDWFHFEENDAAVFERKRKCLSGELLCGECKKQVAEKITSFLRAHQEKKRKFKPKAEKILGDC